MTKNAETYASSKAICIINKLAAAVILIDSIRKTKRNVFDLGGGAFLVTLLPIVVGVFEVFSTYGDIHHGALNIAQRFMDYINKLFYLK